MLQGPSADFIIGRVFENAVTEAYDGIVKKENGITMEPSKWIEDKRLQKSKAQIKYLQSNCVLLK